MAIRGTAGDTAKGEVVTRRPVTYSEVMRDRGDLVLRDLIDRRISRKLIARKYGIGRRTLYDIIARAPRRVREMIYMQPRPYREQVRPML